MLNRPRQGCMFPLCSEPIKSLVEEYFVCLPKLLLVDGSRKVKLVQLITLSSLVVCI